MRYIAMFKQHTIDMCCYMAISTLAYIIGVFGGLGGVVATMGDMMAVKPVTGLLILFASIALLWIGLILESVEESSSSI